MTSSPLQVVVAGGGVAGLEALLAVRDLAGDRAELTLLTPGIEWLERAMAVATPFSEGHPQRIPLSRVVEDVGARMVPGVLTTVDVAGKRALGEDDLELRYDALLVAPGARLVPAVPGALTWTPESAPAMLGGLLRDLEEGYAKRIAFVVPEGVTWALPAYELALMTAREVGGMGQADVEVLILTPEPSPLAVFGPAASAAVAEELGRAGVRLECGVTTTIDHSQGRCAILEPGHRVLPIGQAVALPRCHGPEIRGLAADERGFILTDRFMRVRGAPGVWAAGDAIAFPTKQGGLAAQEAEVAAAGIAAAAGIELDLGPFRPVLRGILLTGEGRRWMHRTGGGEGATAAHALWWPPAKIAAPRLAAYLDAEGWPASRPAGHAVLRDLIRELPPDEAPDTAAAPGPT